MQDRPIIRTALPRRRYQIGDYAATLLGEIESGDGRDYRFILALVPGNGGEPVCYITCEAAPPARAAAGAWDLRVVSEALTEVMDSADHWADLDHFAEQGLDLARQLLGLGHAPAFKLQ
ncbi:MAG: hypothetical protein EA400_16065 [Chromatiaceae bacterium]|nr:MAG: hypothetical protein EA400_16065 [Chromatiaceae bacterium]